MIPVVVHRRIPKVPKLGGCRDERVVRRPRTMVIGKLRRDRYSMWRVMVIKREMKEAEAKYSL